MGAPLTGVDPPLVLLTSQIMMTTREAATACMSHDAEGLTSTLAALPPAAFAAFVATLEGGEGWDAAACAASLAAPETTVPGPYCERLGGKRIGEDA